MSTGKPDTWVTISSSEYQALKRREQRWYIALTCVLIPGGYILISKIPLIQAGWDWLNNEGAVSFAVAVASALVGVPLVWGLIRWWRTGKLQ
jgi:hypothetical protein